MALTLLSRQLLLNIQSRLNLPSLTHTVTHGPPLLSSPLAKLLFPRFTSSCGKLKLLHLLSADLTVFSSVMSFVEARCYFLSALGSIFPATGAAGPRSMLPRRSLNVTTFSLGPISDSETLIYCSMSVICSKLECC